MASINVPQKTTGKESHGGMHRVGKLHPDFPETRETLNLETKAAETSGLSRKNMQELVQCLHSEQIYQVELNPQVYNKQKL